MDTAQKLDRIRKMGRDILEKWRLNIYVDQEDLLVPRYEFQDLVCALMTDEMKTKPPSAAVALWREIMNLEELPVLARIGAASVYWVSFVLTSFLDTYTAHFDDSLVDILEIFFLKWTWPMGYIDSEDLNTIPSLLEDFVLKFVDKSYPVDVPRYYLSSMTRYHQLDRVKSVFDKLLQRLKTVPASLDSKEATQHLYRLTTTPAVVLRFKGRPFTFDVNQIQKRLRERKVRCLELEKTCQNGATNLVGDRWCKVPTDRYYNVFEGPAKVKHCYDIFELRRLFTDALEEGRAPAFPFSRRSARLDEVQDLYHTLKARGMEVPLELDIMLLAFKRAIRYDEYRFPRSIHLQDTWLRTLLDSW
ncbi:hypothetical protein HK102_002462 [Quaeritorhiza haematococci]|nr:hypothetical protein HK102_002462 [Quaeritorhiza haematococci]